MIYLLINTETGEIAAHTIITPLDTDTDIADEELLEMRLESAIADEVIPDDSYEWIKDDNRLGVLI